MLNLLYVGEGIERASKGYIGPLIDIETVNPSSYRYKNYFWGDINHLVIQYSQVTIRMPSSEEREHYRQMSQDIINQHERLKIALNPLDKPGAKD